MARVTVEDCLDKVKDRFELVAIAAQRAKNIASGEALTIERNEEKDTVLSLREIAGETVSVSDLQEALVKSFQREREIEDEIPEDEPQAAVEEEISAETKEMIELEGELAAPEAEEIAEKVAAKGGFSFEEDNLEVDD